VGTESEEGEGETDDMPGVGDAEERWGNGGAAGQNGHPKS
jgi:hypothetical protein